MTGDLTREDVRQVALAFLFTEDQRRELWRAVETLRRDR